MTLYEPVEDLPSSKAQAKVTEFVGSNENIIAVMIKSLLGNNLITFPQTVFQRTLPYVFLFYCPHRQSHSFREQCKIPTVGDFSSFLYIILQK